ncbi:MAG TPA: serine hydrolase domain-containing protein [Chloroflexota bacterium]|nr:serine hydrolase domain-containing protein [Chloroflexota bacterium]
MAIATRNEIEIEAAPEDVGMSTAGLRNVSRLVQSYIDDGKLPGAISLVARRGKVVHFETYGNMDAERSKPMRSDTIFRFYSMTKPIASVGLMMLYEQGRFQLEDPASKFIPELQGLKVFAGGTADRYQVREAAREMTVRDLLMHTSGLVARDTQSAVGELYRRAGFAGADSQFTLAEMVRRLSQIPLEVDPGSQWIYGISTDLVGYLCEALTGLPFDRYLQERILGPLGMVDTSFSVPESKVDRFAANYAPRAGAPRYRLVDDPLSSPYTRPRTYFSGSGGLVSTAADYLRFCRMLSNGGHLDGVRIIGPRTLRLMTINHLPGGKDLATMAQTAGETAREGVGFGLGFAVLIDQAVAQIIGTPGEFYWGGAASTAFFVNPVEDLIMIFLTQLRPSSTYPLRRELRATIYSAITA